MSEWTARTDRGVCATSWQKAFHAWIGNWGDVLLPAVKGSKRRAPACIVSFFILVSIASAATKSSDTISYNRDIRPILSDNCFYCHGPDPNKRKAKMRLDIREEALKKEAFVPGEPGKSELVRRIFATDPEDLMPPPASNKKLTQAQKETLRRWIAAGAKYEIHWAYQKPVKAFVPAGANAIDFLIQKRLKEVGLAPNAEADRLTLARRLYFDLIGLPPKPEEAEAFLRDKSPDATSKLIEKLLASPHFGERMAIGWLDAVRFADTIGYHSDNPRNVWPYRDYVIRSFNQNKRFDTFTREQIAGDLLPGSSQEQKVGSAFNRLLLTTEEGGAQPKDYEARMLTDRVRAIGTVWLGQTIGCAQCHDHKFDPITQRDFYSMGAFFADIKEAIIGNREDGMIVTTAEQAARRAELESNLQKRQRSFDAPHPELADALTKWEDAQLDAIDREKQWTELAPARAKSAGKAKMEVKEDNSVLVSGKKPEKDTYTLTFTNLPETFEGLRLEALPDASLPAKGPGRAGNGNFVLTRMRCSVVRSNGETQTIVFTNARASIEQERSEEPKHWSAASVLDEKGSDDLSGWAILPGAGTAQQLVVQCASTVYMESGDRLKLKLIQNHGHGNHTLGRFRVSVTSDANTADGPITGRPAKDLAAILVIPADERDKKQTEKLWAEFKKEAPELADLRKQIEDARKAKLDYDAALPHCLVSMSNGKPRVVRILPRGNFLNEGGDIVQPALPGYLKASWQPLVSSRHLTLVLPVWTWPTGWSHLIIRSPLA